MTNLEELIYITGKLSDRLSLAAAEEKRFSVDICLRFEQLSWEMIRLADEIIEIKSYTQNRI